MTHKESVFILIVDFIKHSVPAFKYENDIILHCHETEK